MKRQFFYRFLFFLVLPLILAELILRTVPFFNDFYISKAEVIDYTTIDTAQCNYIFIGSSHVAAAIVPEIADDKLSNYNVQVINAGRGSSSSTVFYYALCDLAKRGLLNHAKVFLEAPAGMSSYSDNKEDEWLNSQNVHLLVPYLDFETFKDFWRYSDNKIFTKLDLTMKYLFYTSRIWSVFKEVYHSNTISQLISKISKQGLHHVNTTEALIDTEITDQGGIKSDSTSIQAARDLAVTFFDTQLQNIDEISVTDWGISRLNDINNMLVDNNSELIIFKMPISSVEDQVYNTVISKNNIEQFHEFLKKRNIKYIDLDFSNYSDNDFPDLWHLSKGKAIEFTRVLVDSISYANILPDIHNNILTSK